MNFINKASLKHFNPKNMHHYNSSGAYAYQCKDFDNLEDSCPVLYTFV